jgi:hypothetical protein
MTKSIATASINRETAVALIDAAIAAARTIGIPAAVAVVDATGNLRAFERTDDAPFPSMLPSTRLGVPPRLGTPLMSGTTMFRTIQKWRRWPIAPGWSLSAEAIRSWKTGS